MTEQNKVVSIGGNIESALKGDYTVDVKAVLTEAWQLTQLSRKSINLALLFIFLFGMLVSVIASSFFGGIELVFEDPNLLQLINVIVTIAVWPFIAGVEMMGIFHSLNKRTNAKMVFSFLNRGSWVALCALFTSVLISLGFQLLIVPGIVLAALLSLTVPLVVEKKLSPIQAIILSVKALRFQLIQLLAVFALLSLALVAIIIPVALMMQTTLAPVGIILFLFGLSYIAPWYYNVKGILYREIFGIYAHAEDDTDYIEHSGSDDTFSA